MWQTLTHSLLCIVAVVLGIYLLGVLVLSVMLLCRKLDRRRD